MRTHRLLRVDALSYSVSDAQGNSAYLMRDSGLGSVPISLLPALINFHGNAVDRNKNASVLATYQDLSLLRYGRLCAETLLHNEHANCVI